MRSEWYVIRFGLSRKTEYNSNSPHRYDEIRENDVVHMQGFLLRIADGEPFTQSVVTASSTSPQTQIEEANEAERKLDKAEDEEENSRVREMIADAQRRGLSGRFAVNNGRAISKRSSGRLSGTTQRLRRTRTRTLMCSSREKSCERVKNQTNDRRGNTT